ncbi:MAG: hypothetical protein HRU03_06780 [Nanoarchaeales archaeon]|nr:hypothetical protein [Nanoarchaeales archaeon]
MENINKLIIKTLLPLALLTSPVTLANECNINTSVTIGSSQRPVDGFEPVKNQVLQILPSVSCKLDKSTNFNMYGFANFDLKSGVNNELDTGISISKKLTKNITLTGTLDFWAPQKGDNYYVPGIKVNYGNSSYNYQKIVDGGERHIISTQFPFNTSILGEDVTIMPKISATITDDGYFGLKDGLTNIVSGVSISSDDYKLSLEYHKTKRETLSSGIYAGISFKF